MKFKDHSKFGRSIMIAVYALILFQAEAFAGKGDADARIIQQFARAKLSAAAPKAQQTTDAVSPSEVSALVDRLSGTSRALESSAPPCEAVPTERHSLASPTTLAALYEAIKEDRPSEIDSLLGSSNIADLINTYDPYGMTLLHWAVAYQKFEIACKLINAGANVKARNAEFMLPDHFLSVSADSQLPEVEKYRILTQEKKAENPPYLQVPDSIKDTPPPPLRYGDALSEKALSLLQKHVPPRSISAVTETINRSYEILLSPGPESSWRSLPKLLQAEAECQYTEKIHVANGSAGKLVFRAQLAPGVTRFRGEDDPNPLPAGSPIALLEGEWDAHVEEKLRPLRRADGRHPPVTEYAAAIYGSYKVLYRIRGRQTVYEMEYVPVSVEKYRERPFSKSVELEAGIGDFALQRIAKIAFGDNHEGNFGLVDTPYWRVYHIGSKKYAVPPGLSPRRIDFGLTTHLRYLGSTSLETAVYSIIQGMERLGMGSGSFQGTTPRFYHPGRKKALGPLPVITTAQEKAEWFQDYFKEFEIGDDWHPPTTGHPEIRNYRLPCHEDKATKLHYTSEDDIAHFLDGNSGAVRPFSSGISTIAPLFRNSPTTVTYLSRQRDG